VTWTTKSAKKPERETGIGVKCILVFVGAGSPYRGQERFKNQSNAALVQVRRGSVGAAEGEESITLYVLFAGSARKGVRETGIGTKRKAPEGAI